MHGVKEWGKINQAQTLSKLWVVIFRKSDEP